MRHQPELSYQGFMGWDGFIAHISMRVPADEAALVAGPHVLLAWGGRRLSLEDLPIALGSLDALVVAAHALSCRYVVCCCPHCTGSMLWIAPGITRPSCASAGLQHGAEKMGRPQQSDTAQEPQQGIYWI